MYCGACARDMALLSGLSARGHEIDIVQLYTPMRPDGYEPFTDVPVYLGGISVYLEQTLPFFDKLPQFIKKRLDDPELLRKAGKYSVSTKAETLGPMTVSMLQGVNGRQKGEVNKLLAYIRSRPKPDVIVVTNALLSGLAPAIKNVIDVPVICGLTGEDSFIDQLPIPYRNQALELIEKNSGFIDIYISPGYKYADFMAGYLKINRDRICVAYPGIRTDAYNMNKLNRRKEDPFVIGYLSSIDTRKGIDILVEAVIKLRDDGRDVLLHTAGKALDTVYWKRVQQRAAARLGDRFVYYGEINFAEKVLFLSSCNAFCVPSRIKESRGMAVMEAIASGTPVVVPNDGFYPELIKMTNGGLLHTPDSIEDVARRITFLMDNPDKTLDIGAAGYRGIRQHLNVDKMVDSTLQMYEQMITANTVLMNR